MLLALRTSVFFTLFVATAFGQMRSSGYTYRSDLGFSYSLSGDWIITKRAPIQEVLKDRGVKPDNNEVGRKAAACLQRPISAHRGTPPLTVIVLVLPFECVGLRLTADQLPVFGKTLEAGYSKEYDLSDPSYATYQLGSHSFWLMREKTVSKIDRSEARTLEFTCTVTQRTLLCWNALASDGASLYSFENTTVSLDGESAKALVPAGVFRHK